MEIIDLDINKDYKLSNDYVLCLGMFDGVHIGHQELFKLAKKENKKIAVLTFKNSPKSLFLKREDKLVTPVNERLELFNNLDIDIVLIKGFTLEFASISAISFINNFLKVLNPYKIVVGDDYSFGKDAKGNISLLKEYFNIEVAPKVEINNQKVSTTQIIKDLENGNISEVNTLLGRFYKINGNVTKGYQNGRTIGFPTANIIPIDNYFLPKDGVYIGKVKIDNTFYKAMINIGKHPTIKELKESIIEVHIIDFNENIYEKNVEVYFISFLREEKKFNTFDELKKELEKNVKETITYLEKVR